MTDQICLLVCGVLAFAGPLLPAQSAADAAGSSAVLLASGTPLAIRTELPVALRVGERIHGSLLYPVWQNETKVLPEGTVVTGTVVSLEPDAEHRLRSRLRGDLTPFRKPTVRFDEIALPGGSMVPIKTEAASEGAPLVRLTPPPPEQGGFFAQHTRMLKQMARDRIAVVTGPDKRDRAVQYLYTQLPYHPQRIEPKTAWTVETTEPLPVPLGAAEERPTPVIAAVTAATHDEASGAPWLLEAYLKEPLSSSTAHQGEAVHAMVAKPVYAADGSLAVPEGARLEGAVTQVRPARWWGRAGVVRFDFRQLRLPDAATARSVQTSLTGVDAPGGKTLQLDTEGRVKPKPQDKIIVPLLLFALAGRPQDRDGNSSSFGNNAAASNSLGLAGFLVGTAGGWPNVASGIGYYGSALSVWNRWIKRGPETIFTKDTRVIVQTTARRAAPMAVPTP